ncbi:hypothetical protein [Candidatus Methanocrinis natronophilus]|uniref:Uncharacterized protein n=1 Tax=Candidatus Methanocrinis natronophilus TaxID=3033396 RepID=A0ABT5XBD0_9EURY|nr:hypothetical protein [Candidatus Methanocrinis natronophilus]MDF0591958.1 hypothetical protein [Candidatus Methanocrinis natronophilus]
MAPLSDEDLEARAERIPARNARLQDERAARAVTAVNPDRSGFNLLEVGV